MIKYSNANNEVIRNGKIIVKKENQTKKQANENFMNLLDDVEDFVMKEGERL